MNDVQLDLTKLIPYLNKMLEKYQKARDKQFGDGTADQFNMSSLSFPITDNLTCEQDERYTWLTEREHSVTVTMVILGCLGLVGNLMSCVVIAIYLLKFSGTFVLFLCLCLSDSLVVVMQIVDAYRNSVMADFHTETYPVGRNSSTSTSTTSSLPGVDETEPNWFSHLKCKSFLFLWHFALQLSAWLVMALSIDRYASLKHIYANYARGFQHRRGWWIFSGLLVFLAVLNSPFLVYTRARVLRMPCSLSHFCIYETPGEKTAWSGSSNPFDVFETKDQQTTNTSWTDHHLLSRKISLWLSSQHLVIFGVIPYSLTLIFNLMLIRCLRSCPKPQDFLFQCPSSSSTRSTQATHAKMSYCCFMQFTLGVMPKTNRIVLKTSKIALTDYFKSKLHRQQNARCSCGRKIFGDQLTPEGHPILPTRGSREEPGNTWLPLKAKPKLIKMRSNSSGDCPLQTNARFKKMSSSIPTPDTSRQGWWVGRTRTTILLLVVTFTFIGLSLPYLIYTMLTQFGAIDKSQVADFRVAHTVEELCRFLLFVNNCLNLCIHMTGHQFRRSFYALLARCRTALLARCRTALLCDLRPYGPARHSLQAHWYRCPPGDQPAKRRQQRLLQRHKRRVGTQNLWLPGNEPREGLCYKASLECARNQQPLAVWQACGKRGNRRVDVQTALLR